MNRILHRIYDDIIMVDNNFNQIFMNNNGNLRTLLFIMAKVFNQIKLQLISLFNSNPNIEGKHLFIVITNNQFRSIKQLSSDNYVFVKTFLDSQKNIPVTDLYFSPFIHPFSLCRNLVFFIRRKELSWKMIYIGIAYFYYFKEFYRFFKKNRPLSITITNPTHPILRSAVIAGRDLCIPTVYIPHASPSPVYPPIKTDYALLEGEDALTYYSFSPYTKKLLVGSPRLDIYQDIKPVVHDGINVLIATNLLDDMDKVREMILRLRAKIPFNAHLILRPHPNQILKSDFIKSIGDIEISNSKTESCMEALQRSDILLAGNTTTFFEAIYLPIDCYYFNCVKSDYKSDSYNLLSYSFIKPLDFNSVSFRKSITKDVNRDLQRIDYAFVSGFKAVDKINEFYQNL